MTMRTKRAFLLLSLAVFVLTAVSLAARPQYIIREHDNDAQLMWNDKEALVFIGYSQLGWSMDAFQRIVEVGYNIFGGATPAEAIRPSVVVVRYSPKGIEKYLFNDDVVSRYMAFEGHVYNAQARRWSGTRFEPVDQNQTERFWPAMRSYDPRVPHDGWAYRSGILHSRDFETRLDMWIGQVDVQLVVGHSRDSKWVDFQTAGRPPQRVWEVDERPKHLTKDEYDRLLGR
jgi:hypothetical protein